MRSLEEMVLDKREEDDANVILGSTGLWDDLPSLALTYLNSFYFNKMRILGHQKETHQRLLGTFISYQGSGQATSRHDPPCFPPPSTKVGLMNDMSNRKLRVGHIPLKMRGETQEAGSLLRLCSIPGRGGRNTWAQGDIQPFMCHLRHRQCPPRETQKSKQM